MTLKTERRVWQIACGERGRYYEDIFLDHDVMFLGPGKPGPYVPEAYAAAVADESITKHEGDRVRAFYREVQPGDVIYLRKGYKVIALGIATEQPYCWNESLDDVYGWDLRHCRPISWQRQFDPELSARQKAEDLFTRMKQIPTFTRVSEPRFLDPLKDLFARLTPKPTKDPPLAPDSMKLPELGERLFSAGLPNDSVDHVLRAIDRQRRLIRWYKAQGDQSKRPTEHEVVAHMVLPLLLALGWSEQLLAIEWNRIDRAGFAGTPTTADRCVLVCEAKQMGQGMQDVWKQAFGYVEEFGLHACRKVLLSGGERFYLYERADGAEWPDRPTGYLNVMNIRGEHVAPKGTSAIDTIVALTPMNLMRG